MVSSLDLQREFECQVHGQKDGDCIGRTNSTAVQFQLSTAGLPFLSFITFYPCLRE